MASGWSGAGCGPGDELSIAHIRYRLENGVAQEMTLADPNGSLLNGVHGAGRGPAAPVASPEVGLLDKPLAEVVRNALGASRTSAGFR